MQRYEGGWKSGKRHGKGIFSLGNGEVYSGYFVDGHYHGRIKRDVIINIYIVLLYKEMVYLKMKRGTYSTVTGCGLFYRCIVVAK